MKHSNKTATSQTTTPSLRANAVSVAIHTQEKYIDCHEFDKSNSRNDKKTAQSSLRGSGFSQTKQSIILNKHKIDCHESLRDSRNDGKGIDYHASLATCSQ